MDVKAILRDLQNQQITLEQAKELLATNRTLNRSTTQSAPHPTTPDADRTGPSLAPAHVNSRDIAIISMAGRFPGANDVRTFWKNLKEGRDCIVETPTTRWDYREYYSEDKGARGRISCKWGGFLDEVEYFDPLFFKISPREAELMEPQERLMLEVAWTLFEQIGYTRQSIGSKYQGNIGVFTGSMYQQYHAFEADIDKRAAIAMSSHASMANRISHFFGLNGPSVAVDTMCSSGGTAVHLACESLISGASRLAIAAAGNLSIHPYKYVALSQAGLLASSSARRSFADADGFLPSEAVAAVLLKPLADAIRDDDPIIAVIKSTAVNHKGSSDGFSVPKVDAIAELIAGNHARSNIDPATISYIECAATGAPLADAAEIDALIRVYGSHTPQQSCAIGSVKSNIGHPEAAAGICQLIKVALQLQHGHLVPTIKTEPLNPNIRLDDTPFYLQRTFEPWRMSMPTTHTSERALPRRAAITTLGAGGSNSHLILEEYCASSEAAAPTPESSLPQILIFSAKTRERLTDVIANLLAYLDDNPAPPLDRLAYTLQRGREEMPTRAALVVQDVAELPQRLRDCLDVLGSRSLKTRPSIVTYDLEMGDAHSSEVLPDDRTLEQMIDNRQLDRIAYSWTRGAQIPWERLHGEKVHHQFVQIPTYPFAKLRCWISPAAVSLAPTQATQTKLPHAPSISEISPATVSLAPTQAAQTKLPHAPGAPSIIEEQVLNEIVHLTKIDRGSLNPRTPLVDLGLNSVSRLLLASALCRRLPFLNETRDGGRLIACTTANELIACIAALQPAPPEKADGSRYSFTYPNSSFIPSENGFGQNSAVIIGAGPGGLMAALTLKNHGMNQVVLVEKRNTFSRMQMITLYQHTLPYLKLTGMLDKIVARASLIRHHDFYLNKAGRRNKYYSKAMDTGFLHDVDERMDYSKERVKDHFVGESVLAISLADLQDVLMQEVLARGVTFLSDVTATVERNGSHDSFRVRLECDDPQAGGRSSMIADPGLIVIADGTRSQNAQAAGITYADMTSPRGNESWYVYHCRTDWRESALCYEFSFDDHNLLTDCAFGLFYPQRSEFGVALYRSDELEPSQDFLREKAEFLARSQGAQFGGILWQSKRIGARFSSASHLAIGNVVITGDAAGNGSPNAGLGAVLAISAYGWALKEYCDRRSYDRDEAIAFYNDTAKEYALNWQNRSRYIWSRTMDLTNLPNTQ